MTPKYHSFLSLIFAGIQILLSNSTARIFQCNNTQQLPLGEIRVCALVDLKCTPRFIKSCKQDIRISMATTCMLQFTNLRNISLGEWPQNTMTSTSQVHFSLTATVYSCFDKGCPKKRKSVRNNAKS